MYGFDKGKCNFCNNDDEYNYVNGNPNEIIHICPLCGIYTLNVSLEIDGMFLEKNINEESKKLSEYASYFYYNGQTIEEYQNSKKRFYIGTEKTLENYLRVNNISNDICYSIVNDSKVNSFIPKKFSDKEFLLLKDIYSKRDEITDICKYDIEQIISAAFVTRQNNFADNYLQFSKLIKDLEQNKYIEIIHNGISNDFVSLKITTKGIKYIEEGDNQMDEKKVGSIVNYNYGNMVTNSTVTNSIVGNNNSMTDFDYDGLKKIITEIENLYKSESSFSEEQISVIAENLEEIKQAIQEKNQPIIQKCLKSIGGFVTNVSAGIIASGIWTKIQPFMQQIPGM